MSEIVNLSIADVLVTIEFDRRAAAQAFIDSFASFIVPGGKPDVSLNVRYGPLPDLSGWQVVFEAAETWKLLCSKGRYALQRISAGVTPNIYQVAIFNSRFRTGEVYIIDHGDDFPLLTIENYLMEILFVHLLSQGQGVMLHAAVVDDCGLGRVFTGQSGAGKSTLSQLWVGSGHGKVLCDDRVILRKRNGQYIAYGTPWRGTAGIAVPGAAPLKQLFVLKQAPNNRAVLLRPLETATLLLTRSFPTFWDAPGMTFTLDFLAELSQEVPCFELEFAPQPDVIDFVRCL